MPISTLCAGCVGGLRQAAHFANRGIARGLAVAAVAGDVQQLGRGKLQAGVQALHQQVNRLDPQVLHVHQPHGNRLARRGNRLEQLNLRQLAAGELQRKLVNPGSEQRRKSGA